MKKTVCLVGLFLAFVFVVQSSFAGDSKRDCYPGNGSLIAAGATSAKGEAEGPVGGISTDRHGVVTSRGPAEVEIEFEAKITGPNDDDNNGVSTGRAKLKIYWLDPSKTGGITETEFESACVIEIETDVQTGFSVGEFEGEYEGSVENFPGYPGTGKAAVLSIVVHEDGSHEGRLQLDFSIDLGYQCFENVYVGGGGDIETGKVTLDNLDPKDFHIKNVGNHGRVSFPDQNSSCDF
jgi:hypothetical protein